MKSWYADLRDAAKPGGSGQPRARERMDQRGASSLSDQELVMILLGTGMRGRPVTTLAQEVLGILDGGKEDLKLPELTALAGMGSAKAATILAALELGRRLFGFRQRVVRSPGDIYPLVRHWADRRQERFICATLNGAHEVIDVRVISTGLINRTVVHPREVYADAITDRACAIAVAHNHPSGRLEPSQEDIEITQKLAQAGQIIGLPLLDHIVFSDEGYFSFVEQGLLVPGRDE